MALITLSRATELVPNFPSSDNSVMQDCIDAASDVIERWCNRTFAVNTYDELYDGTGDYSLLLNNYPIVQVTQAMFNPVNVMQVRNTDQGCSRASFRLDGWTPDPIRGDQKPTLGNLYLVSLKNGVETDITIGPLTSATPTVNVNGTITNISQMFTFSDLATVINTYGGSYGWAALALGIYTTWPIADLHVPQGAFECRWFGNAYVTLHSWNLPAFEQNPDIGEIVSPMGFAFGYRNFRIIYQAGYSTIPNPVQQACAALAVSIYQGRGQNYNLTAENLGGYSYSQAAEKSFHQLDIASRYGLALYKNHRIAKFKITA